MLYKHLRYSLAISLLPTHASSCIANVDNKIDADGPDYVESSEVVGQGHVQIEVATQAVWQFSGDDHYRSVSTPVLLRYGLSNTL